MVPRSEDWIPGGRENQKKEGNVNATNDNGGGDATPVSGNYEERWVFLWRMFYILNKHSAWRGRTKNMENWNLFSLTTAPPSLPPPSSVATAASAAAAMLMVTSARLAHENKNLDYFEKCRQIRTDTGEAKRVRAKKNVFICCVFFGPLTLDLWSLEANSRCASQTAELVMKFERANAKPNIKTLAISNGVRRNKNEYERTIELNLIMKFAGVPVLVCATAPQSLALICDFSHSASANVCVNVWLVSHQTIWTGWHLASPLHNRTKPNNETTEGILQYRKCVNPPAHTTHTILRFRLRVFVGTSSREQKMQIIQWT